jgi:hypothetical protein
MVSIDIVITAATSVVLPAAVVAVLNLMTSVVSIVAAWLRLREARQSKRRTHRGSRVSLVATGRQSEDAPVAK